MSARLLAAVIFVLVILSAVNYVDFYERTQAIEANAQAGGPLPEAMLRSLGASPEVALRSERDHMVYREIGLVVVAGIVIWLLWLTAIRRRPAEADSRSARRFH